MNSGILARNHFFQTSHYATDNGLVFLGSSECGGSCLLLALPPSSDSLLATVGNLEAFPHILCPVSVWCRQVMRDKGTPHLKKNVFFRALPKLPLPPPSPLLSGNLYIFFGRHKGIYKVYFLIRARPSPPPSFGQCPKDLGVLGPECPGSWMSGS